ncbi:MAG: hypothetical protein ABIH76_04525 [Candidatus Bathyarchaeota archaeon]
MSENLIKVSDLNIGSRGVNINLKVANKLEERQITSRVDGSNHRVSEATVGDDTGCVLLTLWDDALDTVQPNDKLKLENGFVSLFKNSMRLNVGRYGKLSKIEDELPDVNTKNNISEKVYERQFGGERRGRFGGSGGRGGGYRRDRY